MTEYRVPTLDELLALGERREAALTAYIPTAPTPAGRETARTAAKSAIDDALRRAREAGEVSFATERAWRAQSDAIATDPLWERLADSVALFVTPDGYTAYVLPNELEPQTQFGHWFDLGQLVRAVTTPQSALALTLAVNSWNLWEATPTSRATLVELEGDVPEDAADATNRSSIRGRKHYRRLVGDEGRKVLLDQYAARVAEALRPELARLDPSGDRPLFLFANEPLASMYRQADPARRIEHVPGAADELKDYEIDEAIRAALPRLNAEGNSALVDVLGAGLASGRTVTELADIARAAVESAIDTLVYDFTIDVLGHLNRETGEITLDDEHGHDLLSQIAVAVLRAGGRAIAVRPAEVAAEAWNGLAIAGLRRPLH